MELLTEIKGLRNDVSKMQTQLSTIETTLASFDMRINSLEKENQSLKKQLNYRDVEMNKLHYKIDSIDQRGKQLELIVSSPEVPSSSEETFKDEMKGLLKNKLKITDNFLSRLSFRRIGQDGQRKALITAANLDDKIELLKTARLLKPPNFYVTESLIKARNELFYNVRKFKKDNNLTYLAYSFHGEIYVKFSKNGQPLKVTVFSDIVNACSQH